MSGIEEYVTPAWRLDRDGFGRAFPHPFLLRRLGEAEETHTGWRFKTDMFITSERFPEGMRPEGVTLSQEARRYRVFPVVKAPANPWRERISVGRAGNNDIVLPEASVSKLHAHFITGDEGVMYLADAGSRNGTTLNDKRLAKGERVRVEPGDMLCLGRVQLTLVDALGFYDFLQAQMR